MQCNAITNIKNVSEDFEKFAESFQGCNYNVWFKIVLFDIKNNASFSVEYLESLILETREFESKSKSSYDNVKGTISSSSWNLVEEHINDSFAYKATERGEVLQDFDIVPSRTNIFWSLVKKYISLPCEKIYVHNPGSKSYFDFYVMWGFCYILIKGNKGLLLSGGSYD